MKVLIISRQYPPEQGGGGSHVFYLASSLSALDCDVTVLTSPVDGLPPEVRVNKKLRICRAKERWVGGLVQTALELCNKELPQIVHGQHLVGGQAAVQLKTAFRIPVAITFHKTPLVNSTGEEIRSEAAYTQMRSLIETGKVDLFIAGSIVFQEELRRIGANALPPDQPRLIYHGVPTRLLRALAYKAKVVVPQDIHLDLQDGETLILCPARLDRRKNLHSFVAAAVKVARKLPDRKFKFLITTPKPSTEDEWDLQRELQAIASINNLMDRVIFKTFDFSDLPKVFRFAAACILPSDREGLGLVLLEAMAIKVPVIAARASGVCEVITSNGDGGLLFEPGDAEELASCIVRVVTDGMLAAALKRRGYSLVQSRFAAHRMAVQHLGYYHELATSKNLGSP